MATRCVTWPGSWGYGQYQQPEVLRLKADLGDDQARHMLDQWLASAYHFDPGQPLYPAVLSASHAAAGADDWPERHDWHPDQVRLMRELSR